MGPSGLAALRTHSDTADMTRTRRILTCLVLLTTLGGHKSFSQSQKHVLLTEPESGRADILQLLDSAQDSITLTIYEIDDSQILSSLIGAAQRGVKVRVIYNYYSFEHFGHDPNAGPIAKLNAAGAKTQPASKRFLITHQKTFVVDQTAAVVMTFNLRSNYFSGTRDFGVITYDRDQVAEISSVFEADWADEPFSPSEPSLVWSPDNSRAKILGIIDGAAQTLEVYNEETADKECMAALISAANRGVQVRFLTAVLKRDADSTDANAAEREALNSDGVQAKGLAVPYIHAKMILADNAKAFLGSENFSKTSLDKNRELGIIVDEPAILESLKDTFEADWGR